MVWMAIFHLSFDLDHFRFIDQDFRNDPFWTVQRTCIVALFLLCAGAGQAIATAAGQPLGRFWKRWAQVAACAGIVSIASWWMFPGSFISFGVLHGIAVMLVVVRFTASWGLALLPLGLLAIALPHVVQHPVFDSRWLDWTGLVTRLPVTEDYVPVLPWLGVMWWGAAAASILLRRARAVVTAPVPAALSPLAALGRWSLSFYMLHQPVLIGIVAAVALLVGRPT